MAVTSVAKPGDMGVTFSFPNTSSTHTIRYGITNNGKIYRERILKDVGPPPVGGPGTWVDTGLTIPDVSTLADL